MLRRYLAAFLHDRCGQDLVEYTLLIAFLALSVAGLISQVGKGLPGPWTSANSTLSRAMPTAQPVHTGGGDGGDGDGGGDGH